MSAATELQAGPELDAEIARRVFGFDLMADQPAIRCASDGSMHPWKDHDQGCRVGIAPPSYSTDIAAAWLVVEKMREREYVFSMTVDPERVLARFDLDLLTFVDAADTAPLAICKAALAALEAG